MDDFACSEEDIRIAKEICALHNRQLPAIKELRAKLNLSLSEACHLSHDLWNTVDHPENVEYNGLDRVE